MLKELNSIIKKIAIISIIFALFLAVIISQNTHHLNECHDHNCSICSIIQIAQVIINMIEGITLLYGLIFTIFYLLTKINKIKIDIKNDSLVYKKVQLNE